MLGAINLSNAGRDGNGRRAGDLDKAPILFGQDAGLIDSLKPAGEIIEGLVAEAEEIIKGRLARLVQKR